VFNNATIPASFTHNWHKNWVSRSQQRRTKLDKMQLLVVYIGGQLKQLRDERFLSHRELARLAGVSPTTVLSIERNETEPQRRTIRKLASALGVEPSKLVEQG
jgi:DNA-binding XRE family transcriptional regulator